MTGLACRSNSRHRIHSLATSDLTGIQQPGTRLTNTRQVGCQGPGTGLASGRLVGGWGFRCRTCGMVTGVIGRWWVSGRRG
ncbi:hypothetical protein [Actinokineospora sp.]|uniref:hypothetical protein n=1 Tax=Actinokineospora sp. TaxID=1872133 RepID=UPI0040382B70